MRIDCATRTSPESALESNLGVCMSPESFTATVAVAVFVAGGLGLLLQRTLPDRHTTGGSRDMVGAVAGLLALLSALVLGLLIWTAYGVYAGQNLAVQTVAAKVLQLDLDLERNPIILYRAHNHRI